MGIKRVSRYLPLDRQGSQMAAARAKNIDDQAGNYQ
jgi:hypothetical protein